MLENDGKRKDRRYQRPGSKPKGLLAGVKALVSWSDKNDQRLQEMISLQGAKPLIAKAMSLVAGNVTGGGGKATKTKT